MLKRHKSVKFFTQPLKATQYNDDVNKTVYSRKDTKRTD